LIESSSSSEVCSLEDRETHPILCNMMERKHSEPETLAVDLHRWSKEHGLLVDIRGTSDIAEKVISPDRKLSSNQLPVVLAHGMGDSCFNSGMQHITELTSQLLGGVYSVCIPTGKTQGEDTQNGYFLNMNANVDIFAKAIRDDPNLQDGFHAIGFSQGNNVIRGYMTRYNEPTVHTFISLNGVNAGEGALPHCFPNVNGLRSVGFDLCELLMEQASHRAYTSFSQEHSFQANYWRDPRPSMKPMYQRFSQLAEWNNEVENTNSTLKENYLKTKEYVWVLATEDGMVWPREGEQWGAPDPIDPFKTVLPMEETEWYIEDLFGLRTAQEQGRNHFEQFDGDHLQFSNEEYTNWIMTYLAQ